MADAPATAVPASPDAPASAPTESASPGINFTKPGDSPVVETKEGATETKTEKPTEEPKKPVETPASLKAAARAAKEARDAKAALAKVQKDFEDFKAANAGASEAASLLEAIKKNPAVLLKHGFTADDLVKKIIEPENDKPEDPAIKELREKTAKLEREREEERANREKLEREREEQATKESTQRAQTRVATELKAFSDEFYFVDADDAPEITKAIVDWCEKSNFVPSGDEHVKDLVKQAAKQIHEQRAKRFGNRINPATQTSDDQRRANNAGIDFTDSRTKPSMKPIAPSSAKVPTDQPLPTPKPKFEIGFTS